MPLKDQKNQNASEYIKKRFGFKDHAFIKTIDNYFFGMAIFSKFKIKKYGQITTSQDSTKNGIIFSDIILYDKVVRICNFHLESYNLWGDSTSVLNKDVNSKSTWSTIKRFAKTWRKQQSQIDKLNSFLKENDKPLILMGDLNNPPFGNFYKQVRGKLQDTWVEKGSGLGRTYGSGMKGFRIDYIFPSTDFKVIDHQILEQNKKDHSPILSKIRFKFHD